VPSIEPELPSCAQLGIPQTNELKSKTKNVNFLRTIRISPVNSGWALFVLGVAAWKYGGCADPSVGSALYKGTR
jgi:hypothetical protein